MKLILESTTETADVNGVTCRRWVGKTEAGIPVQAFIPLIAVERSEDQSAFERELSERTGRIEPAAIPLRFFLD